MTNALTDQQWRALNALERGWLDLETLGTQIHATLNGAATTCRSLRKRGLVASSNGWVTINNRQRWRIGYRLTAAGMELVSEAMQRIDTEINEETIEGIVTDLARPEQ